MWGLKVTKKKGALCAPTTAIEDDGVVPCAFHR